MIPSAKESKLRVRALFGYNPKEDPLIPCAEAGLTFHRGDILHIVSMEDANWWQAKLEVEYQNSNGTGHVEKAGLIPSRQLQEKILSLRTPPIENNYDSGLSSNFGGFRRSSLTRSPPSLILGHNSSKRVKKIMYETRSSDDFDSEDVKTYEDIARLYPRTDFFRPVVFIGPPGVGRNELKRRLMMLNPNHFGSAVPHTSRNKREGEMDGVEYYFVSRDQMETFIIQGRFIEYGEYKGNLYGTLLDSVKTVINQGRVCILNPHPQAIRMLRTPEIKPFIIFVKPPQFAVLKDTRTAYRARSLVKDSSYSRGFTDEELEAMLRSAAKLDAKYGHLFDYILTNGNIEFAFKELLDVINRLEKDPQWVPLQWVR